MRGLKIDGYFRILFKVKCGCWIPAGTGQVRIMENGKAEELCSGCAETSSSLPQSPKVGSGVSLGRAEGRTGLTGEPGRPNQCEFRENG